MSPGDELRDRRELARWAENLYEEVVKLEEERNNMESQLEASQAQQTRLETELEATQRRCAQLERAVASTTAGAAAERSAAAENAELRKQLAAYAVEIDVLREEKQAAARAVYSTSEQMQHLAVERDELHRSVAASNGDVALDLTVTNVNFDRLHESPELLQAFHAQLKRAISEDARQLGEASVCPEHVAIEGLTRGSVRVQASVSAPAGSSAGVIAAKLGNSQTLARGVAMSLEAMDKVSAAREGPIGVHSLLVKHRRGPELEARLRQLQNAHDSLQRSHDAIRQNYDSMLESHGQLQREHDALTEQHGEEQALRVEAESRLEANRDDMDARLQSEADRRQEDRRHIAASTSVKEDLGRIVQELMKLVDELQQKYVSQTRHYEQLAKAVRKQQLAHMQDVQDAVELTDAQHEFLQNLRGHIGAARNTSAGRDAELQATRDEATKFEAKARELYDENRSAANHVRAHQDEVRWREERENERQMQEQQQHQQRMWAAYQRYKIINNPNIAKAMVEALTGKMVQKITGVDPKQPLAGKPQLAWRWLKVVIDSASDGTPRMSLMWAKAPYTTFSDKSMCDLNRVLILGFGFAARAPALLHGEKGVVPERCFSVFTPRRSFDFVCNEDSDAEIFMLVLSRLCYRIQGWPVAGSIPTHAKFVGARGWCKVQKTCRERRQTLCKVMQSAAHQAVSGAVAAGFLLPRSPGAASSGYGTPPEGGRVCSACRGQGCVVCQPGAAVGRPGSVRSALSQGGGGTLPPRFTIGTAGGVPQLPPGTVLGSPSVVSRNTANFGQGAGNLGTGTTPLLRPSFGDGSVTAS